MNSSDEIVHVGDIQIDATGKCPNCDGTDRRRNDPPGAATCDIYIPIQCRACMDSGRLPLSLSLRDLRKLLALDNAAEGE